MLDTVRLTLEQRDVELELIVVDDGSSDGTAEALEALGDPRVTVLRNAASRGVAHARNRGIERATHPWIAFLDDDDRWSPDKLRVQLDLARAEDADFVYTAGLAVAADGRVLWRSPAFTPAELRQGIRSRNLVFAGSSNVLARTELLRRLGGFDESLHHIADWDLWIRLTEAGRGAACPEALVAYVVHETNMHQTVIDSAAREGRLLRAKHAQSSLPGPVRPHRLPQMDRRGTGALGPTRARCAHLCRHGPAPPQPPRCAACGGRDAASPRPPPRARGRGARRPRAGLASDPPIARRPGPARTRWDPRAAARSDRATADRLAP